MLVFQRHVRRRCVSLADSIFPVLHPEGDHFRFPFRGRSGCRAAPAGPVGVLEPPVSVGFAVTLHCLKHVWHFNPRSAGKCGVTKSRSNIKCDDAVHRTTGILGVFTFQVKCMHKRDMRIKEVAKTCFCTMRTHPDRASCSSDRERTKVDFFGKLRNPKKMKIFLKIGEFVVKFFRRQEGKSGFKGDNSR